MTRYRRAGSRWRLLVHDMAPKGKCTISRHIQSHPDEADRDGEWCRTIVLPDTEFDELVVGNGAIHVEQLDTGLWWMAVSGVVLHVKADRDGRPKRVTVHMPGEYDGPVVGCLYDLNDEPWEA